MNESQWCFYNSPRYTVTGSINYYTSNTNLSDDVPQAEDNLCDDQRCCFPFLSPSPLCKTDSLVHPCGAICSVLHHLVLHCFQKFLVLSISSTMQISLNRKQITVYQIYIVNVQSFNNLPTRPWALGERFGFSWDISD